MIACGYSFSTSAVALSEVSTASEYRVKAAYLYNFARFVTWPRNESDIASTPIRICTYGSDPFGVELDSVNGKMAKGRVLEVLRLVPTGEVHSCQILYVAEKGDLKKVLDISNDAHILTVGEDDSFTELGGVIRFRIDEKISRLEERVSIGLDINTTAAERSHLKISSRMLNLARIVKDKHE